jgi:transcription elongation factor GreA
MTKEGHAALKEELSRLKSEERPSIIAQIAEAREHGDLSENAEYHAAKERQGFIEARIKDLESKLGRANVIDPSTLSGDKVVFGATVTILDYDSDEKQVWQIVGDDETDLKQRKIGLSSPVARALIGKEVGDEVEIRTPKGKKECEVLGVEFK